MGVLVGQGPAAGWTVAEGVGVVAVPVLVLVLALVLVLVLVFVLVLLLLLLVLVMVVMVAAVLAPPAAAAVFGGQGRCGLLDERGHRSGGHGQHGLLDRRRLFTCEEGGGGGGTSSHCGVSSWLLRFPNTW